MAQGIIHPYYAVALAAPLGGLVGIATMGLWERRSTWPGRLGLAAALAATVWWSSVLLGRTPNWFPSLRPFVLIAGALGVLAVLLLPLFRSMPKLAVALASVLGLSAVLAAPLLSTVATANTPHTGAIPSVTPSAKAASVVRVPVAASPEVARAVASAVPSPVAAFPVPLPAAGSPVVVSPAADRPTDSAGSPVGGRAPSALEPVPAVPLLAAARRVAVARRAAAGS